MIIIIVIIMRRNYITQLCAAAPPIPSSKLQTPTPSSLELATFCKISPLQLGRLDHCRWHVVVLAVIVIVVVASPSTSAAGRQVDSFMLIRWQASRIQRARRLFAKLAIIFAQTR